MCECDGWNDKVGDHLGKMRVVQASIEWRRCQTGGRGEGLERWKGRMGRGSRRANNCADVEEQPDQLRASAPKLGWEI